MMAWTHKREHFKLYSLIAGKVAEVRRLGDQWRANVWTAKGASTRVFDYSQDAKFWAEQRWKGYAVNVD